MPPPVAKPAEAFLLRGSRKTRVSIWKNSGGVQRNLRIARKNTISQRAVWRNGGGKCGIKRKCKFPPLRQAAIPLCASGRECGGQSCGNRGNLNVRHN